MRRLKYGKIKNTSPCSNVYGTTVQLIIRMKNFVEGQYELYEKIPDSGIIPSIIDAYEQLKSKNEFLNIDPFIHAVKKEIHDFDLNAQFKKNFFSVLSEIDSSYQNSYKPIVLTNLQNKSNHQDELSYFFDILLENNKPLSSIIENQYEFPIGEYRFPYFLFFYPTNNEDQTIKIFFDDTLKLENMFEEYTLTIIVATKRQKPNFYILYIGFNQWIRIENEDILILDKKDVYSEISDQTNYRIKLLGYCKEPQKSIVSVDTSEPIKYKYLNMNDLEQQITTNQTHQTNSLSIVTYVDFDYANFVSKFMSTKMFDSAEKRDEYLTDLRSEARTRKCKLYYDCGNSFGSTSFFDENEIYVTVYSISPHIQVAERPIQVLFKKYEENEKEENIEDKLKDSKMSFFHEHMPISQLFEYCRLNLPGKPTKLIMKNKIESQSTQISYDQKLVNDPKLTIKSIFNNTNPMIIYYVPSIDTHVDDKFVILNRSLRTFLYDSKKKMSLKRIVLSQAQNYDLTVLDILYNIINIKQDTNLDQVLTYYISDISKDFEIEMIEKNTTVSELSPFLNIQFRPHKGLSSCICILFDERNLDISTFDPNKDGYPFAVQIDHRKNLKYFKDLIIKYLFHSDGSDEKLNLEEYFPTIYKFESNKFSKITELFEIRNNPIKPVFVTWKSSDVFNEVIGLIKKHIEIPNSI